MRAIIQRVLKCKVEVDQQIVGQIAQGWLVLLGVQDSDSIREVDFLVDKILKLRAFNDDNGKMNLALDQVDGSVLVVSQFTLYGDVRKGRRPSFTDAAKPEHARMLYEKFVEKIASEGVQVQTGIFAADMKVELINDGPVTFTLDTASLM